MHIDPALLSPVSALMGALIGGSTTLVAAVYTQRHQDRLQRVASETAKRETVYADFVMSASSLLLNAYTREEILLSGDEQRLIGLINRMRLFAPPDVVEGAEAALRGILEILLNGVQTIFNEDALAARGRCAGLRDQLIELVEIALGEVAGALGIGVLNFDGDDAALLVVADLGQACEVLGCVDAVALAVDVLQVETIDEMSAHRSASQQIDEERRGGMRT